ncbi:MAG: DUF58 domain-containing protein [Paenibacillaceae bacterium]
MTEVIANRNRFPIAYLLVESVIPASFKIGRNSDDLYQSQGEYQINHRSFFSLPSQTEFTRHYNVICKERGRFDLSTARLSLGDILGFHISSTTSRTDTTIFVYPSLFRISDLPVPARGWLETVFSRDSAIGENHFQYAGTRPYQSGDRIRMISWKATAKSNQLMVHKRETILDDQCWIFLNIQDRDDGWDTPANRERLELGIRYTASLVSAALKQGCKIGFACNESLSADPNNLIRVQQGSGNLQMHHILEKLSLLQLKPCKQFGAFLSEQTFNMRKQNIFVITAIYDTELSQCIRSIQTKGNFVEYVLLK